ncbi:MAG TPA: PAS domain S-box protein [Anaerolineales bacterium]|nr:PAS domain S-box protein [Anaerolineales bacterium]
MEMDHKAQGRLEADQLNKAHQPSHSDSQLNTKHQQIINTHLPIGIVESSLEGKYLDVNEEFCRMLGYEREELLQRGIKEVTQEEDYHVDMKLHRQLVSGEIPYYKLEKRFVRKDGQVIWADVTRCAIRDGRENPLYVVGIILDITERHFAEEALLRARTKAERTTDRIARLQKITAALTGLATTQQVAEMILEQGTQATGASAGVLVEVLENGMEIRTLAALGYPSAAIRTDPAPLSTPSPMSDCILSRKPIWLGSHADFAARYPGLAELRGSFGHEATAALPLVVGSRVLGGLAFSFVEVRGFDAEEKEFLLAVARHCGQALERGRSEDALRESEERFRAILSQATAGIVRKSSDGTLLFVNDAFCKMVGYSSSELVLEGKTCWDLTHPDDLEENRRLFDRMLTDGVPFQMQRRLIRRDGSVLWSNLSVSPIRDASGKPVSSVGVEFDITDQKQAEEALRQLNLELESRVEVRTAELQSMNRALHESRRRLQVLSQRLVQVQEEERRSLARELHDRVGQSLIALNLNLTIIQAELFKGYSEQLSTRLADSIQLVTEVITLVRDVMSNLRPTILDDYGLESALQTYVTEFQTRYGIPVRFEKRMPPIPRLDSSIEITLLRISQEALTNIARHAQASQAILSLRLDEQHVYLTIEDDGIGIPAVEGARRLRSHGLKIMQERAEALEGTLKIHSAPGKGTRIEVGIPLPPGEQLVPSQEQSL